MEPTTTPACNCGSCFESKQQEEISRLRESNARLLDELTDLKQQCERWHDALLELAEPEEHGFDDGTPCLCCQDARAIAVKALLGIDLAAAKGEK